MNISQAIFLSIEWVWRFLGASCIVAAGIAVVPANLSSLESDTDRYPRVPLLFFGLFIPFLITAYKMAEHEAHHLMVSSAIMANTLWNAAHGYGLVSSIDGGKSMLAGHFGLTYLVVAPALLLWNSMAVLIIAHGLFIGLAAFGTYRFALQVGKSGAVAWLAALLLLSNPLFKGGVIAFLDNVNFAPSLLIWGAYAWAAKKRGTAVLLGLLLLTTREQVPFLLFGGGLYFALRTTNWKERAFGIGVSAASVLLWFAEMAVITRAKKGQTDFYNFWGMYQALGGSQQAVTHNLVHRPWIFVQAFVLPPEKLWTAAKLLFSFACLPLASDFAVLPAFAAWVPQQLADPNSFYHALGEHYAAIILGPAILCATWGMIKLHRAHRSRRWLAPGVLFVAGVNFLLNAHFQPPKGSLPHEWAVSVPNARKAIPADAKLWCDEFLTPDFALRRYIKALPRDIDVHFEDGLFEPDAILLSTNWIRLAAPQTTERIFTYLHREHFESVFQEGDLIVLARPSGADRHDQPVKWLRPDDL